MPPIDSLKLDDAKLPALASALDTGRMLPLLASALEMPTEGLACRVEVLKHIPGKRCTLRYELSAGASTRVAFGKLYRSRLRARTVYSAVRQLAGALPVARPIAIDDQLHLVLQEAAPGVDLRHPLAEGRLEVVESAARWLATLHQTPPPAALKTMTVRHETRKAARWCERIAGAVDTALARPVSDTTAGLRALADALGPFQPALMHKDFYYAHVLCEDDRIAVIDFDEMAVGDPAFDVGHFLAHLENLAYRATGSPDGYRPAASAFLHTYEKEQAPIEPARLRFYRTYTFLKLAATEVDRRRGDWRRITGDLAGLASSELAAVTVAPGR
jgi:aminoglycoside phosphotransferase (APT) family kinase protein